MSDALQLSQSSKKKFPHSPEIYILDNIRTRSFIPLPEQSYIDIALTLHLRDDVYILSYSGKIYHYYGIHEKTNGVKFSIDQTKTNPLNWSIKRSKDHIELIPFGLATYDFNYLTDMIENYYNNHLIFMKKENEIDKPSIQPFSQKQRDHLNMITITVC